MLIKKVTASLDIKNPLEEEAKSLEDLKKEEKELKDDSQVEPKSTN